MHPGRERLIAHVPRLENVANATQQAVMARQSGECGSRGKTAAAPVSDARAEDRVDERLRCHIRECGIVQP
ncbi:MAG TPA: hypothetical protein VGC72_04225 [Candidatus Elarobacter sp.]